MNTLPSTPAFANFANARFYDLHLLRLLDSRIPKQAFIDYVRSNFDPPLRTESEVEDGAEHLRQYLFQIQWTRAVDSFQRYLVEVLRDVLRSKPEIMASSDAKLTYEEVLKAADIESLIRTMIDRTVRPLVGLRSIEAWFEKRKIPLVIHTGRAKTSGRGDRHSEHHRAQWRRRER